LRKSGEFRWFTVYGMGELFVDLPAPGNTTITVGGTTTTVTPPAPQVQVTYVFLDSSLNDPSRREGSNPDWQSADGAYVKVHFGFRRAGTPAASANLTLGPDDPITLTPPVEAPQDGKARVCSCSRIGTPTLAAIAADIDFVGRTLTPVNPRTQALVAPVTAYGNVVTASRGETVSAEVLGSGDASIDNQTSSSRRAR